MTWREIAMGAAEWAVIIGMAHLLAKLDGRGLFRRRKTCAQALAQLRGEPLTPVEEKFARTLLEAAAAVPCPLDAVTAEEAAVKRAVETLKRGEIA